MIIYLSLCHQIFMWLSGCRLKTQNLLATEHTTDAIVKILYKMQSVTRVPMQE